MSEIIQQHYVPQMILRRFAGEDGKLDVVERTTGRCWRSGPSRIACERYYNAVRTNTDELDTQSIEKDLSGIESRAEPSLAKLLHGADLLPHERHDFALFITTLDFRSPRKRQEYADLALAIEHHGLSKSVPQSIEHYKEIVLEASRNQHRFDLDRTRADSRIIVEEDGTIAFAREDTIRSLRIAGEFTPIVENMEWMLFMAPEGKRFILSDSPVQLYEDLSTLPEATGPAYWRPNSVIIFPLTSLVCFLARHAPSFLARSSNIPVQTTTARTWAFFNDLQSLFCYRQVYAAHATEGLKRRCASLQPYRTSLSFMPVSHDGTPVSAKLLRRK